MSDRDELRANERAESEDDTVAEEEGDEVESPDQGEVGEETLAEVEVSEEDRGGRRPAGRRPSGGGRFGGQGGGGFRPGGGPPGTRFRRRRAVCSFCVDKVKNIDYKDIANLREYLDDYGKIKPARKTGNCAKHQRRVAVAVKRARHLALLPFTSTRFHRGERSERFDRGDRYDRGDRGDRGDRYDRGDRGDRGDRFDRGDRYDRGE